MKVDLYAASISPEKRLWVSTGVDASAVVLSNALGQDYQSLEFVKSMHLKQNTPWRGDVPMSYIIDAIVENGYALSTLGPAQDFRPL